MSDVISIKELLEGVVVEWKPLGSVAGYEQPTKYLVKTKNYSNEFKTPVLTAGKSFILGYTDETNGIYQASKYPVIIFDDFTTANKWVDFDFKAKSSAMKMITSKDESEVLLKYIYYWLNTLPSDLIDGDHKRQWISNFSNKFIPVPSLQVQSEIVKTLDNFTELTAELTAELATELTARRIQYNYYLDRLLNFKDEQIEWKTFKEVTLSTRNIKWKDTNYTYRYIDLASVSREKNLIMETFKITANNAPSRAKKIVEKNDVIFATTRPTQQRFCLIDDEYSGEIASTGYCILRAKSNKVLPKWIYYHVSSSNFKNYVDENQSGSAYPAISDAKVKDFLIPIPTIKEQEQIVSILDKLETLTISIIEGLPKEIKLRQQQYEYYRDLLLTFPKNDVEV